MNRKSVICLGLCLVLGIGQTVGISDAEAAKKQSGKISLNHSKLLLGKGNTARLRVKKGLSQKEKKKKLIYKSSNSGVIAVNSAGKLRAKKAGSATVSVRVKGTKKSASCQVTVVDRLKQVKCKVSGFTMKIGETQKISQYISSDQKLEYECGFPKILKITKDGRVKALEAGTTEIGIKIKDSIKDMVYLQVKVLRDKYDTPLGFDDYDEDAAHGEMTEVTYYSSVTGTNRKCMVYTPPGYTSQKKYNVLYCMHGIGGDHKEWYMNGKPHNILDNLYAADKLADMIVVFPNGRAMKNDSVPSNIYSAEATAAFSNFENDLKKCLMPFINETYPVYGDKQHTAMAGLSMGGMQTVNIGLKNLELFDYYGIFSPAPTTDANKMGKDKTLYPRVTWLSVGTSDTISGQMATNTHNILTENGVEHIYYKMPGGHDWNVWKNGLYNFVQLIFKG